MPAVLVSLCLLWMVSIVCPWLLVLVVPASIAFISTMKSRCDTIRALHTARERQAAHKNHEQARKEREGALAYFSNHAR